MELNSKHKHIKEALKELRVLLVDDDAFIRRVTVDILKSLNISNVLEAENGLEAMSILKLNKINLLITDIQMPEVNGIELVKQIRLGHTSCDQNLRTIVITSFSNMEVVGACLALDINGFLVKPITPANAIKKIEVAMTEQATLAHKDGYELVQSDLESLEEGSEDENREVTVDNTPSFHQNRDETGGSTQAKLTGPLILLRELQPGMELVEDIYSKGGAKLISSGRKLNESLINRIDELSSVISVSQIRIRPPN